VASKSFFYTPDQCDTALKHGDYEPEVISGRTKAAATTLVRDLEWFNPVLCFARKVSDNPQELEAVTEMRFETRTAELCVAGFRYRLYDGRPHDLKFTYSDKQVGQEEPLYPHLLCECAMLQIEADADNATGFKIITMDAKNVYVDIRLRTGFKVKMRMWSVDFVLSGLRRLQQELTWKIGPAARNFVAAEAIHIAIRDKIWPVGAFLRQNRAAAPSADTNMITCKG
jgi:hypothetical protein